MSIGVELGDHGAKTPLKFLKEGTSSPRIYGWLNKLFLKILVYEPVIYTLYFIYQNLFIWSSPFILLLRINLRACQ